MEEAKIKAYRVQVTDLENGKVVVDKVSPAYLCVTIANESDTGGQYSASLCGKSGVVSMKGIMGLVAAGEKAGDDFLKKNIDFLEKNFSELVKGILGKGILPTTNEEIGEFEKLLESLREEDEDD